jgi:hypothetical protein
VRVCWERSNVEAAPKDREGPIAGRRNEHEALTNNNAIRDAALGGYLREHGAPDVLLKLRHAIERRLHTLRIDKNAREIAGRQIVVHRNRSFER